VFTEAELKLLGTQKKLRETWNAKVHARGRRVNSKGFWRWRITLRCEGLQWLGLVVSNGPNCGRDLSYHLRTETYPVSETLFFWEQQTIEEVQELIVSWKGNEFVIWLKQNWTQQRLAKNYVCGPPAQYTSCKIWRRQVGIPALINGLWNSCPLSPCHHGMGHPQVAATAKLQASPVGLSSTVSVISFLNNHTRWFDEGDGRVICTVLTTFRAL
jgi:hypothetical protein